MSKSSNWANTWWPPVEDNEPIVYMCFRCGADCADDAGQATHECAGLLIEEDIR